MSKTLNHTAAIKRLEALFEEAKIEEKPTPNIHIELDNRHNSKCDVHGKNGRRGSLGNILHISNRKNSLGTSLNNRRDSTYSGYFGSTNGSMGPRRESMPALNNYSHYYQR